MAESAERFPWSVEGDKTVGRGARRSTSYAERLGLMDYWIWIAALAGLGVVIYTWRHAFDAERAARAHKEFEELREKKR